MNLYQHSQLARFESFLLAKQAAEKVEPKEVRMVFDEDESAIGIGQDHIVNVTNMIPTQYFAGATPSVNEIVTALAFAFKVDELQAHKYLIDADFTKWVAEKKAA